MNIWRQFSNNFKSLESCPRELYINFGLKFLESYNYFAISQILVIYLHDEFGASDLEAGTAYGLWGASITFWGLVASWINDNLGVRRSLLIGFCFSFFSTMMLALARKKILVYFILFFFYPIGTSMGIPMLTVGIRRYTTQSNRGFAFGLYYSVMNMAAFVSGPIIDGFNVLFSSGYKLGGLFLSPNRLIILTASFACSISFVLTFTSLREVRVAKDKPANSDSHLYSSVLDDSIHNGENQNNSDDNQLEVVESTSIDNCIDNAACSEESSLEGDIELNKIEASASCYDNQYISLSDSIVNDDNIKRDSEEILSSYENPIHGDDVVISLDINTVSNDTESIGFENNTEEYMPVQKDLCSTIKDLFVSPTFWRFAIFTLFLVNLNAVFRHLDATLPTYLIRTFGSHVPKGTIYSINPFMIIFLTPIMAAFTGQFAHYDMIKFGGFITAIAPFCLAVSSSIPAAIMMVVILSLGESIWSPRTYDYTMSIAPEVRINELLLLYFVFHPVPEILIFLFLVLLGKRSQLFSSSICAIICCQDSSWINEWVFTFNISP